MPWYPKAVAAVLAILALALKTSRPLREWAFRINLRWLISLHLIRFVGFYFLHLYHHRELPYDFAVWGGIGDIIIATLACALIYVAAASKPAIIIWNILGLIDILAVVVTAARSEIAVPGSMHELDHFPLILLPTVAVPLIIVTHALMLLRTFRTIA